VQHTPGKRLATSGETFLKVLVQSSILPSLGILAQRNLPAHHDPCWPIWPAAHEHALNEKHRNDSGKLVPGCAHAAGKASCETAKACSAPHGLLKRDRASHRVQQVVDLAEV
jgi:hypothetical protein